MRSDRMKKGIQKAPHRSLFGAMGYLPEELNRPIIGIASSANELIPGHIHLGKIAQAVKDGVRMAGGTPMEFSTIGVCDGIAMNHEGMKYSLGSRELICDSVEVMAKAYPFDGLVLIPNCDKIIPGMMMAAMRLNIPAVMISGGPMLAGRFKGKAVDLISVFEGVGKVAGGLMKAAELNELEQCACPGAGSCSGMFTAQLHELSVGGARDRAARQRHHTGSSCCKDTSCKDGGTADHGAHKEADKTERHYDHQSIQECHLLLIWPSAVLQIPPCICRPSPTRVELNCLSRPSTRYRRRCPTCAT